MKGFARLAIALSALGSAGCLYAQTGPLVGYSTAQGPMVGWEGGAGGGPLAGKLGAEVRPFGDRVTDFYFAGEPAFALPLRTRGNFRTYPDLYLSFGGTAGLSVDEHGQRAALVGGFAGVPWIRSGDCRDDWVDTLSVSLGVHGFFTRGAPEWTVYATPKVGKLGDCLDLRLRGSFRQ